MVRFCVRNTLFFAFLVFAVGCHRETDKLNTRQGTSPSSERLSLGSGDNRATGAIKLSAEELASVSRRIPNKVVPNKLAQSRSSQASGLSLAGNSGRVAESLKDELIFGEPKTGGEASTHRGLPIRQFHKVDAGEIDKLIEVVDPIIPATVDNSELPSFPPIGNQGSWGSCASFSTVYYQFSHEWCMTKGCTNKGLFSANIFSPKFMFSLVGESDADGYIRDPGAAGAHQYHIYKVMEENGVIPAFREHYDGQSNDPLVYARWSTEVADWLEAMKHRASPVEFTNLDTAEGLLALKQWLANGHVVSFDAWVHSLVENGRGEWLYSNGNASGGHAMTIVGYDDTRWIDVNGNGQAEGAEMGALKVANSWGEGWGLNGFAWLAYDALRSTSDLVADPNRQPAIWDNTAWGITVWQDYVPQAVAILPIQQVHERNSFRVTFESNSGHRWSPYVLSSSRRSRHTFDGFQVPYPDLAGYGLPGLGNWWQDPFTMRASDGRGNITLPIDLTSLVDTVALTDPQGQPSISVSLDDQNNLVEIRGFQLIYWPKNWPMQTCNGMLKTGYGIHEDWKYCNSIGWSQFAINGDTVTEGQVRDADAKIFEQTRRMLGEMRTGMNRDEFVYAKNPGSGKCLRLAGGSHADGTAIEIGPCERKFSRKFVWQHDAILHVDSGKCVTVRDNNHTDFTPAALYPCQGLPAQRFEHRDTSLLVHKDSGKCLDRAGSATVDGTPLILYSCHGAENQVFSFFKEEEAELITQPRFGGIVRFGIPR